MKKTATIFLIISLFLIGCASHRPFVPLTKRPAGERLYCMQFSKPMVVPADMIVENEKDPGQLVEFALALYEKGKYREAAKFFLDAGSLDKSRPGANHFRIACLCASATCLLDAGDIENFHKVVERIKGEMDRFQMASITDEASLLIAISDKLKGKQVQLNPTISGSVKNLFKGGK